MSSASDMPPPLPVSTQSESLPVPYPEYSLDAITMSPDSVSFLNRSGSRMGIEYSQQRTSGFEVFWHRKGGLIVSPNATFLPPTIPDPNAADDNPRTSTAGILSDGRIYLAFRPRYVQNTGDLFARLNLNRAALQQQIGLVPGYKYMLSRDIIERWCRLEDALVDVATTLLSALTIPPVENPWWPYLCGYREPHATREKTLSCVIRSRDAFVDLAAFVSFAISLHMNELTGLAAVFKLVQERSSYKTMPAWFDVLSTSYICNFNPNFRVGGFIKPYTSQWFKYIGKFTGAAVPIWVLWGHQRHAVPPIDVAANMYMPDEDEIALAQARSRVSGTLVLPIVQYHRVPMSHVFPLRPASYPEHNLPMPPYGLPTTASAFPVPPASHADADSLMDTEESMPSPQWEMSNSPVRDSPHSPSPRPETPPPVPLSNIDAAETRKKALAALEEHFRRQEHARQNCLENELPHEKQRRKSWEEHAERTMHHTSNSPVYEWRELPDGTYERVKLALTELDAWSNYTRNQRRHIGHTNSWELCPQLPLYSEKYPQETEPLSEDETEYDSDNERPAPSLYPRRAPEDKLYADDIRGLTQTQIIADASTVDDAPTAVLVECFDFAAFIKQRFGYDIFSPAAWTTKIAPSAGAKDVSLDKAKTALSFNNIPEVPSVHTAVLNLVYTLSNATWTFEQLSSAFDHANERGISLESNTLQIIKVLNDDGRKFLVCTKGYIGNCPWGILVAHASTVLLIFRHRWATMSEIARGLIKRGVPFHTVSAADAAPINPRHEPVRGLGTRPQGYNPTRDDYSEYLRRRKDLLTGPKGRAALMYGGIVARIARDVLEYPPVIDGPSDDAVTVGRYHRFNLYDDALTENDINIICGVYYVDVESTSKGKQQVPATADFANGTKSHMSYISKV